MMDAANLPGAAQSPAVPHFTSYLPGLIQSLGSDEFSDLMVAAARAILPHDHIGCHSFELRHGRVPHFREPLFVRSHDGSNRVEISGRSYLTRWWRDDPDIPDLLRKVNENSCWVSSLLTSSIRSAGYVENCAKPCAVSERIAMTYRSGPCFVSLRLYREHQYPALSADELLTLTPMGELLGALCLKQSLFQEQCSAQPSPVSRICDIAVHLGAPLSAREQQVIEGILEGQALSDLAETLGISYTSAITFRKRAYLKLGIATRSDLYRLCMAPVHRT